MTIEIVMSFESNKAFASINNKKIEAQKRISDKQQAICDIDNNQENNEEIISIEISLSNAPFKIDVMSMTAPIYSLSKPSSKSNESEFNKKEYNWESVDGRFYLNVISSKIGRPTMYDKKILIYIISCLIQRKNDNLQISRTVKFTAYDYLTATKSSLSGDDYSRIKDSLKRLKSNSIKTNIKSNNVEITSLFSLIDSYNMKKVNDKCGFIEVTISQWIFNAVLGFDVITISPDYFNLKPTEKRIYEIARKQVGNQAEFKISTQNLFRRSGSESSFKEFNRMLRALIKDNKLPNYRVELNDEHTVLYQKDVNKYVAALAARKAKKAAKKCETNDK